MTLKELRKAICEKHFITVREFLGRERFSYIAAARREFVRLAREDDPKRSYFRIAQFMNRDEETVRTYIQPECQV